MHASVSAGLEERRGHLVFWTLEKGPRAACMILEPMEKRVKLVRASKLGNLGKRQLKVAIRSPRIVREA